MNIAAEVVIAVIALLLLSFAIGNMYFQWVGLGWSAIAGMITMCISIIKPTELSTGAIK